MIEPITQLATLIAAVILLVLQQRVGNHAKKAADSSAAANDAVNNIHPKIAPNGEPHPSIYELVVNNSKAIAAVRKQLEAHIQPDAACALQGCLRTELAAAKLEREKNADSPST